jgi:hypothetical protein
LTSNLPVSPQRHRRHAVLARRSDSLFRKVDNSTQGAPLFVARFGWSSLENTGDCRGLKILFGCIPIQKGWPRGHPF